MKPIKYLLFYMLIFSPTYLFAQQNCNNPGNVSSTLHPDNNSSKKNVTRDMTSSDPIHNIVINGASYIQSAQLIKCLDTDATSSAKVAKFRPFNQSNIMNETKVFNDKVFYKIRDTSNIFVNKHAYIYFKYSDNRDINKGIYDLSEQDGDVTGQLNYGQGLRVYDLAIAFDKAPLDIIDIPIIIGNLEVSWTKKDSQDSSYSTSAMQRAGIYLKVNPSNEKTCSVSNQVVNLPTIPTGMLRNQGDTFASVDFNVIVHCGAGLTNATLNSIIVDNKDINSKFTDYAQKGILFNIANDMQSANNVSIQVYDNETQRPVALGLAHLFGIIRAEENSVVQHKYSARYYKLDSEPTKAGKVNATATIMVTYQ